MSAWRTILTMKKFSFCALLALTMLCLVLFFGCAKKNELVYTALDGETSYVLTLSEGDMTFVLVENKAGEAQKEYTGEYSYYDGSVVLHNVLFGYRTVKITGNTFEFIANPTGKDEEKIPCEHTWGSSVYTPGNCKTYGSTEYTCTKCGEKKTVKDTAYGSHVLNTGRHVDGEDCSDYGYTVYTCKICGVYTEKKYDTEYADNHRYVPTDTVRDEGCTKVLERLHVCSKCGVEKYMQEDTKAIGAHKDENGDGICDVCGHLKNGLPSAHKDPDGDGVCNNCGIKMSILNGVIASPDGYEEDGKTYMGVYPQLISYYSVKDIKENGLYDEAIDCWYYASETYVIRVADAVGGETTFTGDKTVEKGKEYVFLLQPLAFVSIGENRYVCDRIIDAEAYQRESAAISSGVSNAWENSTVKSYLETQALKRMGLQDKVETITLYGAGDLSPTVSDRRREITDYAVCGGQNAVDAEGKRFGRWYISAPSEESERAVGCVNYLGNVEDTDVTAVRGLLPVITLKQGE